MASKLVIGSDNTHPDGVQVGESATSKVAFYGATPVVKRAGTSSNQDVIPAISGGQSPTAAEHNAVVAQLTEVRATLVALGLWTGADAS